MNASNSQTLEDLREISSILPVKIFSYGDGTFKGNLNGVEAVYHIDNVSFADQGEYICEAFDEHGKARKGAFLKVFNGKFYFFIDISKWVRMAPSFSTFLQEVPSSIPGSHILVSASFHYALLK